MSFPFQIQHGILNDEENQNQQHCEIDFDRLADLIYDEVQIQQLSDNEVDRMIDEETLSILILCFGEVWQILKVARLMTAITRYMTYDARSIPLY